MQSTQKYLRTSPRKLRLVADAVRGMSVERALAHLKFTGKRAASPLAKAIQAAAGTEKNLRLKAILVDTGPIIKRYRPVSRGTAHHIHKPTSHIKIVLERPHGTKS